MLSLFPGVGGALSESSSVPPSLLHRVSVTSPSASRVRHVHRVKNKEAKQTAARRKEERSGEKGGGRVMRGIKSLSAAVAGEYCSARQGQRRALAAVGERNPDP